MLTRESPTSLAGGTVSNRGEKEPRQSGDVRKHYRKAATGMSWCERESGTKAWGGFYEVQFGPAAMRESIRKSLGSGERNGVGRPAVGAAVARPEMARL